MEVVMPEDNKIELVVQVSDKNGIAQYGFAFDADSVSPNNPVSPVLMNFGKGKFYATPGVPGRLIWGMRGESGATMKVEVLRNGVAIKTRPASEIPPPLKAAVDYFNLTVN